MSAGTAAVDIQTSPDDVPTIPPWFAEVTVVARHFQQRGLLDALSAQVRLARGRAGRYDVIDFIALLLGYAISGEATLEAFFARLAPFARPFMALFGRDRVPHRPTLSRFLAAVDAPCLEALRRLFEQVVAQHGGTGERLGGLLDRTGQRLVVIDVDATRQAARQRALATGPELPVPRRRLADVCAPGYTGRKRGEVVRTRTTVLQAHTQQWLGTFAGAGNGDYAAELEAAGRASTAYLRAKGLSPAQGLLRLDGLYGTASVLARLHHHGLGFLVRGRDYQLLDHPLVRARLQHPCDQELRHPETQVQRELFEVGYITDWLAPLTGLAVSCRVVVTRRAAPADPGEVTVGKLLGDHVYELFLTSHPAHRLPAADLLPLYNGRGGFEQVLSDEDWEQDPDRWCSHNAYGQEFWQVLSQWVWNTRLELGQLCQERPLRWTVWSDTPADRPTAAVALPTPLPAGGRRGDRRGGIGRAVRAAGTGAPVGQSARAVCGASLQPARRRHRALSGREDPPPARTVRLAQRRPAGAVLGQGGRLPELPARVAVPGAGRLRSAPPARQCDPETPRVSGVSEAAPLAGATTAAWQRG